MENAKTLNVVEPEKITFDAVEIAGLVVPLVFAVMTIVLIMMNPDPAGKTSNESKQSSERLEQIQRR
jgi:hypothetical protein